MKTVLFVLALLNFGGLFAEERLSSYPYISGDTFRAHCDYIFDETNGCVEVEKIQYGETIFVKTDLLFEFFKYVHPRIAHPYVLVTHNSDHAAPGDYAFMLGDKKLLAWFGQNPSITLHAKFHPIPIGLANRRWAHGNIEKLNRAKENGGPKKHLLYMNFAANTNYSVRSAVYNYFIHQPYCYTVTPKGEAGIDEYLSDVASSKFVVSPRGNGLDCHRTWEAMYLGAIPIVTASELDPLLQGLPVVIVRDWSQVNLKFLEEKWNEQQAFRTQKLWADYWFKQIDAFKHKPYPLQFSISECKVVDAVPEKDQDFATVIPNHLETYIFSEESDYYKDYQRLYFGITCKKGGWDCMRHYEILANGCIPYFLNLEECEPNTMLFLPRELIFEAMHLEGVSKGHIDHEKFDKKRYFEILDAVLKHVRNHLTTRKMAEYLLERIGYPGRGKILYLTNDQGPDYLRCTLLTGLKEILGDQVIDVPKIPHIYKSYPGNPKDLYGKGFSYTKIVEDLPIDRENIEQRIRNKEFLYVIYGSVHRGLRWHNLVTEVYDEDHIVYMCGEENHKCIYSNWPNLFIRESTDIYK